jgi:hypothetical protein
MLDKTTTVRRVIWWALVGGACTFMAIRLSLAIGDMIITASPEDSVGSAIWMALTGAIAILAGYYLSKRIADRFRKRSSAVYLGIIMTGAVLLILGITLVLGAFAVAPVIRSIDSSSIR